MYVFILYFIQYHCVSLCVVVHGCDCVIACDWRSGKILLELDLPFGLHVVLH